jgi:hypothetical protein
MNPQHLDAKSLIEAGRAERLSDAQRARTRARWELVAASASVAHGAAAAPHAAVAGKAALGLGIKAKVIAGLVVLSGVGAAITVAAPWRAAVVAPDAARVAAAVAPPRAPAASAEIAAPPASADTARDEPPVREAHAAVVPHARPVGEASSSLADEVKVLHDVQSALRAGQPARALAILDDAQSRHLGHDLAEERGAARVVALCDLGRGDEARQAARRFVRTWPASALRERVLATCPVGAPGDPTTP